MSFRTVLTRHRKRRGTGSAVAGLALVGLVSGHSGAVSATPSAVAEIQQAWSSVPEYSSSQALAQGKVVNAAGIPVSGATIILFPVPSALKAGTELTPLSRTTSDSSGHFTVRFPAAQDARLATVRSEDALNLHVIAFYPGGLGQWFYSLSPGSPTTSLQPAATLVLRHGAAILPNAASRTLRPHYECGPIGSPSSITQVPVVMGYKSSGDAHLNYSSFKYSTSTSTTLGAAISYSSGSGGFSANGSTTQSAGGSYDFGQLPGAGSNNFQGAGIYYDQEYLCTDRFNPAYDYWQLTQHSVGGQLGTPGASTKSAGYCYPSGPGDTEVIDASKQNTFGGGVDLGVVGISLSAQAGWGTNTELTYKMGDTGDAFCGVGDYPNESGSGAVVVH